MFRPRELGMHTRHVVRGNFKSAQQSRTQSFLLGNQRGNQSKRGSLFGERAGSLYRFSLSGEFLFLLTTDCSPRHARNICTAADFEAFVLLGGA